MESPEGERFGEVGNAKSGSFEAIGWEASQRNSLLLLLLAGSLQTILVVYIYNLPSVASWYHPLYNLIIWPSLIFTVISFAGFALLVVRVRFTVGPYDVSFVDRRANGGALEFTYLTAKGAKRESLHVKSVRPHFKTPLNQPSFSGPVSYVKGTSASLTVEFMGKAGPTKLELGFTNPEEMEQVYEQLK